MTHRRYQSLAFASTLTATGGTATGLVLAADTATPSAKVVQMMGDTQALDIEVVATEYRVCAVPHSYPDWYVYSITVEWRNEDQWAVKWHEQCLGKRGNWDYEPSPSSRTDSWKNAYRHDLETALDLARKAAPKVSINGHTAAEYMAWYDGLQRGDLNG